MISCLANFSVSYLRYTRAYQLVTSGTAYVTEKQNKHWKTKQKEQHSASSSCFLMFGSFFYLDIFRRGSENEVTLCQNFVQIHPVITCPKLLRSVDFVNYLFFLACFYHLVVYLHFIRSILSWYRDDLPILFYITCVVSDSDNFMESCDLRVLLAFITMTCSCKRNPVRYLKLRKFRY